MARPEHNPFGLTRYRAPMAIRRRPLSGWRLVATMALEVVGALAIVALLVLGLIAAPHFDAWVINNRPW